MGTELHGPIETRYFNTTMEVATYGSVFRLVGGTLRVDMATKEVTQRQRSQGGTYDVAFDPDGYMLRTDGNLFEVEDIRTGKIIKTYEKFWGNDEARK